jgi:F-type H+-transporting ATPase subunit gamma
MPANLKELRGKIRNVRSTQQITKAMKLVSAAKFGRAQASVLQSRPYALGLQDLVGRLCGQGQVSDHALVAENSSDDVLLVVISSQRGLCGGYNSNVAKEALLQVEKILKAGKKPTIVCLGRKAHQLLTTRLAGIGFIHDGVVHVSESDFLTRGLPADKLKGKLALLHLSFEKPSVDLAHSIGLAVRQSYCAGQFGSIRFVYSRFGSAISQTPESLELLPLNPQGLSDGVGSGAGGEYLFEPDLNKLVSVALPRFLNVRVLQILKESVASEFGARMTAMDNATRNAKDMERKYKIQYQRARQAAITTELVEIISGAEAL